MRIKHLLTTITVIAGITSSQTIIHTAKAENFTELAHKKEVLAARNIQALTSLESAGLSTEEVEHMQHLLLHKIELNRTGNIPASHQLIAKKAEASANEINELREVTSKDLPYHDAKLIQQAMLHKLKHMQNNTSFTTFN